MSAIAVIRRENGIVIACDSISHDANGVIQSVTANKLVIIPEWDCAIGNVGVGNFSTMIRANMGQKYDGFDSMLLGIVGDFRSTLQAMIVLGLVPAADVRCTLFVAGWSIERKRFESYRLSARNKEVVITGQGTQVIPAFSLMPLTGDWCSSKYSAEDAARFGINRQESDTYQIAAGYVCAARASSSRSGSGDFEGIAYAVGGHLQMTLLERNKVTTWVAHRWPDVVGNYLDPTAGKPAPDWLLSNERAP